MCTSWLILLSSSKTSHKMRTVCYTELGLRISQFYSSHRTCCIYLAELKESADCDLMFVSLWLMDEAINSQIFDRKRCLHLHFMTH